MKILGFDLGDGESAVTLLDEDSTVEPRVIPLFGRHGACSLRWAPRGAHCRGRGGQRAFRRRGCQGALQVPLSDRSTGCGGCSRVCPGHFG